MAAQQGCVDGHEVTGNGGLGAQELGPGHARALNGGVDTVLFEDSPHGGGSNAAAEANEFVGNATAAPGGVVGGYVEGEATQLHRYVGLTGRRGGLGPVAGNPASVPAQQRLCCDDPAGSLRSGWGGRDCTQQGPVLVGEG